MAAVSQFLTESESNPEAAAAWAQLVEQLHLESSMQKYYGLIKNGVYVNNLEVAQGQKSQNETRSGKWVVKRYADTPDSLINVSSSEIKAYYKAHKNMYKQLPNRQLSYVVFEVSATEEDMAALEQEVKSVGEAFATAEDVKAFARENRNGSIAEGYVNASQLTAEEAEALMAGKMYGPVLRNNEWTMARVMDTKMAPDSLGIRHIVLPYTETALADSLLTALKGGADFAEAAAQYSVFAQTAQLGGEVGVMPFAAFTGEFAEQLASAKKGDIVKIASGDAIQLMQVYRADKATKHIRVASINYPVLASSETRRTAHSAAGSFTLAAKEDFAEAASTAAVTPRVATLVQGDAKVGDISEIFTVGDDYVIATLTSIDKNEYTPVEEVAAQIRMQLARDKKFELVKAQMAGATIEEVAEAVGAEVAEYEGAAFGSYYLNGPGLEPTLIGAIASTTDKGVVSAPVKGLNGVYVFTVESIEDSAAQTAEAERVRAQAVQESMTTQSALQAVQEMAEIKDLRGLYF